MKNILLTSALLFAMSACQSPAPTSNNGSAQSADANNTAATPPQSAATTTTDTLCFETKSGKDVFSLQLVINGNSVSGNLAFKYYEKDSAYGTLTGTIQNNLIVADYNYTIEGSNQVEVVEFKLEPGKISRKIGELTEKDGKLVLKNPNAAPYSEMFTKITCTAETQN
ncbi:hypothetical protein C7N43_10855 [Sphingobacteriales bacterium UPWRP_1]|nr:hypothetical protein BVG80_14195 [Sphingobacteriales bacterium TSM_CSM]PSJ77025.1 hypothetical protein C7N43_10855 [Sphingobacteriales bacterium UPWRP_1]